MFGGIQSSTMKFLSIILTCCAISQVFPKRMKDSDIKYLMKYGYMEPTTNGEEHTDAEMREGLTRFQKYNGMTETGEMSDDMNNMMNKSRCGLKDMNLDMPSMNNRARRYMAVGAKWPQTSLSYRFDNFSPDVGESATKTAIKRALDVWSDVTPLEFTEVGRNSNADIIILFKRGEHGDGAEAAFDGRNGVLAHAYFPSRGIGGDAHFDEDELFGVNGEQNRIDLFQVAAHEFGHSMGLGHSNVPGALMAPYYAGYIRNFNLPQDDINGIQFLYGRKQERPDVDPQEPDTGVVTLAPTNPPVVPDMCTSNIDASVYDQTGIFIFQRKTVTRFEMRGARLPDPQPISEVFKGLKNNIDAAYFRFTDRTYIFFKNDLYWEFDDSRVIKTGFPKQLAEFSRDLPNNLNTAVTWGSRYTYFFKGNLYWRYNERTRRVDRDYPRTIDVWQGVPRNLDTGFRWLDGELYFVKDGEYYFYDARNYGVNPNEYPQSFGEEWLRCQPGSYVYSPSSAHIHVYSLSVILSTLSCVFYLL